MNTGFATKCLDRNHQHSEPVVYRCADHHDFDRKHTLAEHVKMQKSERSHLCHVPTCGKRFSTSGNLSRHKRRHGNIEPLKCPVQGCICTFSSNCKLEKHMKFHYGTNVKVCLVPGCGKTFSTTGNLNRHVKTHHGGGAATAGCMSPTPSEVVSTGSPTAVEQWILINPLDGLTLPSDTLESATSQDLLEALESFLNGDEPVAHVTPNLLL